MKFLKVIAFSLLASFMMLALQVQAQDSPSEDIFFEVLSGSTLCDPSLGPAGSNVVLNYNVRSNFDITTQTATGILMINGFTAATYPSYGPGPSGPFEGGAFMFAIPAPVPYDATVRIIINTGAFAESIAIFSYRCEAIGQEAIFTNISFTNFGAGSTVPADGRNVSVQSSPDSVVYTETTTEGFFLTIWQANPATGRPSLVITPERIAQVPALPQVNTQIAASPNGYYRFFRLSTGELQLNSGPDFEGKTFVTIFSPNGNRVMRTYTIDAFGVVR